MKFNCGPAYEVRWERRHKHLTNWHRKFAWFPVRVTEGDCRWLEYVERRGVYYASPYAASWEWEYRAWDCEATG